MPRKKAAPYERMTRVTVLLPFEQWQRLSALGASTPKQWPPDYIPELTPNISKGVRRAFALAEPLIDKAIAAHKAAYDARAANRRKWLEGAEERYRKSEEKARREFYETQDTASIASKPT
jgi:hypothetical protein